MPGAALEMRQVTACGEKETWRICPARLKVSMLVAWFDTASLYREKKYQGLLFLSPGRRLYLLQIMSPGRRLSLLQIISLPRVISRLHGSCFCGIM